MWKGQYEVVSRELLEKESIIEKEFKYTEDLKFEMTKIREEVKSKTDNIDLDRENMKNEIFNLNQYVEKIKRDLLNQQNENANLK